MSFSGKLNAAGNDSNAANCDTITSKSNNVIPLSISKFRFDGDCHPFARPLAIQDLDKPVLAQHLIDCKAKLFDYSATLKQVNESHERQLVALSRQLLEFECSLRKRERELCAILQQRDRVIREQSHIIRFLTEKTGVKKRDIKALANEAEAKMPRFDTIHKTKMTKSKSEMAITSILESESENDSAVILDEGNASVSSSVVRSVSDVMFPETEGTQMPPKHLLRNGSYERYKIRSRMQQHQGFSKLLGNVTLPRNRSAKKNSDHKPKACAAGTTVIVINGGSEPAKSGGSSNSHRSVTKPRDVKNKSNRTKMIMKLSSSPPCSQSPSPPLGIFNKYVQQSGSVYCSLFGDDVADTHSEDDVSYA